MSTRPDNLIELYTPCPCRSLARLSTPLEQPVLLHGADSVASLTFCREGGELAAYYMALGVPEERIVVRPGDQVQLQVGGKQLLVIVRAVTPGAVLLAVGMERGADISMELAATA